MQASRIREIRKSKGLTLAEVAARVPGGGTTAQTIGRLETGMRKLTLDWLERIAAALDTDPSMLLMLPEAGDIPVDGTAGPGGVWSDEASGTLAQRMPAAHPFAVRIGAIVGRFLPGDFLICDRLPKEETERAVGRLALVRRADGARMLAKVAAGSSAQRFTLVPLDEAGNILYDQALDWAAPVLRLVREFGG